MSKTKSMINTCLGEASGSIRAALALAEEADPADTKTRREDVLNQLLVLLNTSTAEKVSWYLTDRLGGKEAWRPTHFSY